MKVMVVGSGGREHALVWKLARSPRVTEVLCAPGNAGTEQVGRNLPLDVGDLDGLVAAARSEAVGLVVVGPEGPLVAGLADRLRAAGIPVFGPGAAGARLEGSKAFAKQVMGQQGIPTPAWRTFNDPRAARDYVEADRPFPVVLKASGLAAGKGVLICRDRAEALAGISEIMVDRAFGAGGSTLVVEEFLTGQEASILCVTDGRTLFLLPTSQDYKRALDGDQGPNTGGMGATSPCPGLGPEHLATIEREILFPTAHALRVRETPYRGVIYAGLMMTQTGPRVLEYNARFGDPETQAVLPRMQGDLFDVLHLTAEGRLDELADEAFGWDPRPSVTVVAAAQGYPGGGRRGDQIEGLEAAAERDDVHVFHAGTRRVANRIVTAGGRVLAVTALGDTCSQARDRAYAAMACIRFEGMQVRRDIGWRAIGGAPAAS